MARSWDVFCRVVDNYGDAAVCWRLATQLADEHGAKVRLWIDEIDALRSLCPGIERGRTVQVVRGVQVCLWTPDAEFGVPSEIVVEAFGCGLPDGFVETMAKRAPRPAWIILEYLSAEPWVAEHHGLPSPHPRLPLQRYFFFPGFFDGTGGVLHEAGLESNREAFQSSPAAIATFWQEMGFSPPEAGSSVVSLFGYENAGAQDLLKAIADGPRKTVVAVPQSRLRPQVLAFFGASDPGNGKSLVRGSLEVRLLPFVPQPAYDKLLWASHWNFVRGEDSFVRAQWARKPFVWQPYPQEDNAHRLKLDAFLDVYCAGMEGAAAARLRTFWQAWNGMGEGRPEIGDAWRALQGDDALLRARSAEWAGGLLAVGNLAGNLAQYCEERLK